MTGNTQADLDDLHDRLARSPHPLAGRAAGRRLAPGRAAWVGEESGSASDPPGPTPRPAQAAAGQGAEARSPVTPPAASRPGQARAAARWPTTRCSPLVAAAARNASFSRVSWPILRSACLSVRSSGVRQAAGPCGLGGLALPAGPAVISPRGQVMRPDLHLAGALLQRFAAQPSQHGVGLLTGRRCWPILARTPRAGPREEGRACTKTTPKSPVRLPVGEPACSRPIGPLGVIGAPRNSHGLPEPRSRESRPATRGPL